MPRFSKSDTAGLVGPAVLSVEEAAAYLGVSPSSIWRAFKAGSLPKAKVRSRTVVRRTDLDAFLDSCVVRAA